MSPRFTHREHGVFWRRVRSIMMEKSAQAGADGACTPNPLSLYLPSRTKLQCMLQLRGHIYSPYFISTPYVLCDFIFRYLVERTLPSVQKLLVKSNKLMNLSQKLHYSDKLFITIQYLRKRVCFVPASKQNFSRLLELLQNHGKIRQTGESRTTFFPSWGQNMRVRTPKMMMLMT